MVFRGLCPGWFVGRDGRCTHIFQLSSSDGSFEWRLGTCEGVAANPRRGQPCPTPPHKPKSWRGGALPFLFRDIPSTEHCFSLVLVCRVFQCFFQPPTESPKRTLMARGALWPSGKNESKGACLTPPGLVLDGHPRALSGGVTTAAVVSRDDGSFQGKMVRPWPPICRLNRG